VGAANEDLCRLLDFDSEFFGFRIGRLSHDLPGSAEFNRAISWCGERGVRCLYFLCPSTSLEGALAAARAGFELIDLRVAFLAKLNEATPPTAFETPTRRARPEELQVLREIAGTELRETRFWTDRRFPRDRAAELYRLWIEKDLLRSDGFIFVTEASGQVTGFASGMVLGGGRAKLSLIAVRSDARGQGLGQALVRRVMEQARETGAKEIETVTQGRSASALRLYESQGFRIESISIWFHRWFEPTGGSKSSSVRSESVLR
jgi:dTDP-4-amino-4,6-dideoxy-D-galactose acyltransferase